MPSAPKRPCNWPGCHVLVEHGDCPAHAVRRRRDREAKRGTAAQRGYGYKWQKASKAFLQAHPLCRECQKHDRVTAATVVDHIIPHRGDMRLFWDRKNWQPLCKPDHDEKTAREDGAFGREPLARLAAGG